MSETVEGFVEHLSRRAHELQRLLADTDIAGLARAAKELKDAGDKLGSQPISSAAEALEHAAKTAEDIRQLGDDVRALVELCLQVRPTAS